MKLSVKLIFWAKYDEQSRRHWKKARQTDGTWKITTSIYTSAGLLYKETDHYESDKTTLISLKKKSYIRAGGEKLAELKDNIDSAASTSQSFTYNIVAPNGTKTTETGNYVTAFNPDKIRYIVADQIGSTRVMLDGNGDVKWFSDYEPFGQNANKKSWDNTDTTEEFTTYLSDIEIGLKYAQNRYYNHELGRFISEDEAKDGYNWYVYANNNPLKWIDPSGLVNLKEILFNLTINPNRPKSGQFYKHTANELGADIEVGASVQAGQISAKVDYSPIKDTLDISGRASLKPTTKGNVGDVLGEKGISINIKTGEISQKSTKVTIRSQEVKTPIGDFSGAFKINTEKEKVISARYSKSIEISKDIKARVFIEGSLNTVKFKEKMKEAKQLQEIRKQNEELAKELGYSHPDTNDELAENLTKQSEDSNTSQNSSRDINSPDNNLNTRKPDEEDNSQVGDDDDPDDNSQSEDDDDLDDTGSGDYNGYQYDGY